MTVARKFAQGTCARNAGVVYQSDQPFGPHFAGDNRGGLANLVFLSHVED